MIQSILTSVLKQITQKKN